MPEHRGKQSIRIARVHRQFGNLLAVVQPQMLPGATGVGRTVNAIADGQVGAVESFATAHVNNIGVGRRDRDGADGLSGLLIENRFPALPGVVGFPDTAVDSADVEHIRLTRNTRERSRSAAAKWSDHSPGHFLQESAGKRWRFGQARDGRQTAGH